MEIFKKKLKEYVKKLQETIKKLKRKNYYLEREGRVLGELIRDYQNQVRILKDFTLMVFILGQLVVELYFLNLFDDNNAYVTIF